VDRHARAAHAADGGHQRDLSAIVIVGAMLAAALTETTLGKTMGVLAVALCAVNVFGGFLVTRRMLEMFKKKEKEEEGRLTAGKH
jgi:H+-translocating NAD(P) transhydrogenase subunit alpha